MESYHIKLPTLGDTEKLGYFLGQHACPGYVYCLNGDLGAGKTTLTQAIASALHLEGDQYVSSPSFAIMHEYHGEIPLYHMDFYRLYDSDDVLALGFDEYFYKSGLTVIEWSERAPDILPDEIFTIDIRLLSDGGREFFFHGTGMYQQILDQIRNNFPAS